MKKETRSMYLVMVTDNEATESDFCNAEEQARKLFDEACRNAHTWHSVVFVYMAEVELSGKPAYFEMFDEDSLCSGLLELERVKTVQCVAIDGKHGLRAGIDLTERLAEVADMVRDVMREDLDCAESYHELKPGELRNIDNEDTETYEEC